MKKARAKKTKAKVSSATEPERMSGAVFKASIEKLYGTPTCQSAFARQINVSSSIVRAWIAGRFPVPVVVAQLVNLMLITKTKPEELTAI